MFSIPMETEDTASQWTNGFYLCREIYLQILVCVAFFIVIDSL